MGTATKSAGLFLIALSLTACHEVRRADSAPRHANAAAALSGTFDNHEQVWRARESASGAPPPHVVIDVEPTAQAAWTIWHVRLDANPPIDATWAMRGAAQAGGSYVLTPHRSIAATPAPASAFDAQQWTPLDACALRGAAAPLKVAADTASCTAIAPGIGASAALLPLGIEREGEWLHVRLYSDQARSADAREDAREVRWFGGWAAINGGGQKADAASTDWHMNRSLRVGSEGGRIELQWRDGSPAGYSLALERMTYRDGNVPVIKLSVVEDSSGRALAYSWANPEATAIGINLGWVQVGLSRDDAPAAVPATPSSVSK
jgi:hypothetical protein